MMAVEEQDMQDEKMDEFERISALADGQLGDDDVDALVTAMGASDEARAAWHSYHVIGDVLRDGDLADAATDTAFVARLRQRLADQPQAATVIEPVPVAKVPALRPAMPAPTADVGRLGMPAANDPVVRWKWLAAAASMAAIAILGWNVTRPGTDAAGQLAAGQQVPLQAVVVQSAAKPELEPVMLRDPRLDELMAAHRQYGATSALPASAGFLRNATFEQPGR
jgi:sigma-E factor negative regulatory protein RseA